MSLIKKSNELTFNSRIKMLVYGQAGIGKTTIALSLPRPLLFDFDNGVHRVNFSHLDNVDTVPISSYQDFVDVIMTEDLSAYDTLVIDTGGKMLDYMSDYLIKRTPKLGKANGVLTLQGYGERKLEFSNIVKKISLMGKNIVFVAHRETKTEGDEMRYVPMFGGSSYDSLVTDLDLVGYMEANGKKRTITFDPSSRNDGKNTCNLPTTMDIPTIIDESGNTTSPNNFLTKRVIEPYFANVEKRKLQAEQFGMAMVVLKERISAITDAESANDFVKNIDNFEHVGSSKVMAGKLLSEHVKSLNLSFNKEKKIYEQSGN